VAKLSPPRVSGFGLRLFDGGRCDYCYEQTGVVYWELRRTADDRVKRVTLCVECMLSAVEAATGFGFVNQFHQWSRQSALMRAEPRPAAKGKSSNAKE